MSFNPELELGSTIDNDRLCSTFQCSPQGGMRRSRETNSLVIVSNHVESIYEDRWDDADALHYTGMGRKGDQSLSFAQNRTLAESKDNGVAVFLFEVFEPKIYTFRGRVELADKPYKETQPDEDGNERIVWMFPLRVLQNSGPLLVPDQDHRANQDRKAKKARRLSDDELKMKAQHAPRRAGRQRSETQQFVRDPHVAEFAKRRSSGRCQLCKSPAPFVDKSGTPYLETHHIVWLSRGGQDSIDNTVALCANCHRRMHVLDSPDDIKLLKGAV